MSSERYRIADEPRLSNLEHLAVQPLWPLLAVMFGGVWLSWPWFLVNAFAIGSPSRWREVGVAVLGLAGSASALALIFWWIGSGRMTDENLSYWLLLPLGWKLAVSYWLFWLQSATFDIYQYFGGVQRNGWFVVFVGFFIEGRVIGALSEASPFLTALLS